MPLGSKSQYLSEKKVKKCHKTLCFVAVFFLGEERGKTALLLFVIKLRLIRRRSALKKG